MKKITLFNPQPETGFYKKGESLPLALLAISSFLDKEGYEIRIFNNREIAEFIEAVKGSICVGITSMTGFQIAGGLDAARKVREKYPEIPIVWGGWHPTLLPEQTVANDYVDIVVRGQAERTFPELVRALENNSGLSEVDGITYKKNGKILSTPDRAFEDLDNFPPLPFHIIKMDKYIAISRIGKRTVNYVTSQGCPHNCGFCPESRVHKRTWKALSAERVISDIKRLVSDYNVDSVIISDNEFFINEKRVQDICRGIIPLHISLGRVKGRADRLVSYSKESWELLRKAGLKSLLIGAESGSQKRLDAMNKNASVQDTLNLAPLVRKYGVRAQYSFFVGMPILGSNTSPMEELDELLDFIQRIMDIDPDSEIIISAYTPYSGTPLFEISKQKGFKEPKNLEEWSEIALWGRTTPWMPLKYAKLLEQVTYYFIFTAGSMHRTLQKYPFLLRMPLYLIEIPLTFIMRIRIKFRIFAFPAEYYAIKMIMKSYQYFSNWVEIVKTNKTVAKLLGIKE
jgi:anaerobic magnesium-protoporphyrin IX monomethyl ester cyclase